MVVTALVTSPAPPRRKASTVEHAFASQAAGAFSTLCFYPMDVVKTRFMAQDGTAQRVHNGVRYTSVAGALRTIVADEGPRALFRGSHVAVFGASCSWGLYMLFYRELVKALRALCGDTDAHAYGFSVYAPAGIMAGASTSVVTAPMWLVKARMQLEDTRCTAEAGRRNATVLASVRQAMRQDGLRSLWRGTSAQLLVGVPTALGFPMYDALKRRWLQGSDRDLSLPEVCGCTAVAKTAIAVLSHPLMLLRARLQDERSRLGSVQYRTLLEAASTTFRREGVRGMYRGFPVGLMHTLPRGALQFMCFEVVVRGITAL